MALNTGLPILPVVISPYDFLDHDARSFLHGKVDTEKYGTENWTDGYLVQVRIKVLDRIESKGHSKESIDSLVKEARLDIQEICFS